MMLGHDSLVCSVQTGLVGDAAETVPAHFSSALALLQLAGVSVAIGLSILLWYVRHFIETLRTAERESPQDRKALEQSPRVFGILAGAAFVVALCALGYSILDDAVTRNPREIPPWSRGYWLLMLCFSLPCLGTLAIVLVALAEIKWFEGLASAAGRLRAAMRMGGDAPTIIEADMLGIPAAVDPCVHDTLLPEDESAWLASLKWVNANSSAWGLAKGFLEKNRKVLVELVDYCIAKKSAVSPSGTSIGLIEREVAKRIDKALAQTGNANGRILNRPLQIARAACAIHMSERMGTPNH